MISIDPGIVHLSGQELYTRALEAKNVISDKFLRAQIGHVIYQENIVPKKRIASILGISGPTKVTDEINYRHIKCALEGTGFDIDGIKSIIRDLGTELKTVGSDFTKIAYVEYKNSIYDPILNELYKSAKNCKTETIFDDEYLLVQLEKSDYERYSTGLGRLYDLGAIGLSPRLSPRRETNVKKTCYLRKEWTRIIRE